MVPQPAVVELVPLLISEVCAKSPTFGLMTGETNRNAPVGNQAATLREDSSQASCAPIARGKAFGKSRGEAP